MVQAHDDFTVTGVKLTLTSAEGETLESGAAVETSAECGRWVYATKVANDPGVLIHISVEATDLPGGKGVSGLRLSSVEDLRRTLSLAAHLCLRHWRRASAASVSVRVSTPALAAGASVRLVSAGSTSGYSTLLDHRRLAMTQKAFNHPMGSLPPCRRAAICVCRSWWCGHLCGRGVLAQCGCPFAALRVNSAALEEVGGEGVAEGVCAG